MLRRSRVDVEARAFDWHLVRLIAQAAKLAKKIICHRSFVASDRFDVHQLAGERDSIHGGENSRALFVYPVCQFEPWWSSSLGVIPKARAFSSGPRDLRQHTVDKVQTPHS